MSSTGPRLSHRVGRPCVAVVIYANQGLRATVSALRDTYQSILEHGASVPLEAKIATVANIFDLQRLAE